MFAENIQTQHDSFNFETIVRYVYHKLLSSYFNVFQICKISERLDFYLKFVHLFGIHKQVIKPVHLKLSKQLSEVKKKTLKKFTNLFA